MLVLVGSFAWGGDACAQQGLFGPDTVHGLADLSWGAADGEPTWIDGGFGKSPLSGGGGHRWKGQVGLSQALVEWKPRFTFATSAVVSLQYQPDIDRRVDVNEAYLKIKAPPTAAGRLSGRIGVFYPPVSLEHDGVGWTTTDLLSASALNSWIGEEVKVAGVEASFVHAFGAHEVTMTGAVFGWNDTAGTLVSFRGWSLGGARTGVQTEFDLPPLSAFMTRKQAHETYPMWELDHRPGAYGRLEWRPPAPVVVDAFYYDNGGDRRAVRDLQWSWQTHFLDLGATWRPDERTRLKAQALDGHTWMGFATPQVWVDLNFRAAYLMAARDYGPDTASARLDVFDTRGRTWRAINNMDETGWAATLGWRHHLTSNADLMLEAQRIDSKRPSRALAGEAPRQGQDIVKSALRLHF